MSHTMVLETNFRSNDQEIENSSACVDWIIRERKSRECWCGRVRWTGGTHTDKIGMKDGYKGSWRMTRKTHKEHRGRKVYKLECLKNAFRGEYVNYGR